MFGIAAAAAVGAQPLYVVAHAVGADVLQLAEVGVVRVVLAARVGRHDATEAGVARRGDGRGGGDAAGGAAASVDAAGLVRQLDVAQDGDHVSAEALVVVVQLGASPGEVGTVLFRSIKI